MLRKTKIIFSFIVLFIGILIFASEYFESKKIAVYDYMNELYYSEEIEVAEVLEIETIENQENNKEENKEEVSYSNKSIYIGYLNIPDIDLKKGFTEKNSKYNTVDKNIEILDASDYPDTDGGNLILAAHSGNSSVSYFKKLHMLDNGATVYVDYKNVTYTYKIVNIYEIEKTGKANIKRRKDISSITLITCTRSNKNTQTIYIGELINKN